MREIIGGGLITGLMTLAGVVLGSYFLPMIHTRKEKIEIAHAVMCELEFNIQILSSVSPRIFPWWPLRVDAVEAALSHPGLLQTCSDALGRLTLLRYAVKSFRNIWELAPTIDEGDFRLSADVLVAFLAGIHQDLGPDMKIKRDALDIEDIRAKGPEIGNALAEFPPSQTT